MNISPGFIKDNVALVQAKLAALGFEKREHGILTIQVAHSVIGWIGLNKATRGQKHFLELNPVVGVRNQTIENLVATLAGEKGDDIVPPTLAGNIGYMMPANKYRPYVFSADVRVEAVAEGLGNDVREYGLPFIHGHMEMTALVEGMRNWRFAVRFMTAYRIPVALFLLGRVNAATECLNGELAKLGDQEN